MRAQRGSSPVWEVFRAQLMTSMNKIRSRSRPGGEEVAEEMAGARPGSSDSMMSVAGAKMIGIPKRS